jgi:tripartite-type tricarboxylate transporter receptor subunit TctC
LKTIATLILACSAGLAAHAQTWPSKPVKVVVPAPAGSSLDIIVRTLGDRLAPRWKQPIVVENKAGAGGMLGMDAVAKAAPDGHTIGIGFNGPIAFGPHMHKKMPYDPVQDLVPVVLTTSQPNVLAVPADNPANTLPEFVAWARQQGGKLNYASVGNGSSSHVTTELFKDAAGFEAVHVPYGGSPPAARALASGEVQLLFTVEPALKSLIQGGRLKLLAATSAKRTETLKSLPTVAESGFAGFEAMAWNGLFVPKGTPDDVVRQLNADVNAALNDPAVRATFASQGLIGGGGTPAEFKQFIASESAKFGPVIKKAGITAD